MPRKYSQIVGLAAIDRHIGQLSGIVANVNQRVQDIAVAIIEHAAGDGAGDVSRALKLVKALPNSFRREYLIRYFRYFASTGIDLKKDKVGLISRDNKDFRGFDVDGARANNWFDAFDAAGNRAPWYEGPAPRDVEPNTLVEFGETISNFVKRQTKQLDATRDDGKPVYALTDEQRETAKQVLTAIDRVAAYVGGVANTEHLKAELVRMEQMVNEMKPGVEALGAQEPMTATA